MAQQRKRYIARTRWRAAWLACAAAALVSPAHADRVYVSNEDGHSVTVIDPQSLSVVATFDVGKRPRGLKLSRDGSQLFVAVSGLPKCPPSVPDEDCAKLGRDLQADGIAVIDAASHRVLKVLQAGSDPEQFAVSLDGKRLFIANEDSASTTVVDVDSGATIARIAVGREPEGVAIAPNGRWVLVTNESDSSVSIIDAHTLKVVKSVPVGQRPRDIAFTADSSVAYVSGEFDASLYRIGVPGGEPVERLVQLRKEARPMAVALDEQRRRLYASTGRGGTVAIIDLDKSQLLDEIAVGARPWGLALSRDGQRLYSANGPSNDVSVVDTSTRRVVARIAVGKSPWGVVFGPSPPVRQDASPPGSLRKTAAPAGFALQFAKQFRLLFGFRGIPKDTASLTGQRGIFRVCPGFDELIVAQSCRDPVDGACTLVESRQLVAARCDAFVHVHDARVGRVVIERWLAKHGSGIAQPG